MASAVHRRKRYVASLGAAVLVIALMSIVAVLNMQSPDGMTATVSGWCCVEQGDACMNGFAPVDCYNAEGFAFSPDETVCQRACGN